MKYNINKGTLALRVSVFYGCVCHSVLPTAAIYRLLKLRKMEAEDQRACSALASTFKIFKAKYIFPLQRKRRLLCKAA